MRIAKQGLNLHRNVAEDGYDPVDVLLGRPAVDEEPGRKEQGGQGHQGESGLGLELLSFSLEFLHLAVADAFDGCHDADVVAVGQVRQRCEFGTLVVATRVVPQQLTYRPETERVLEFCCRPKDPSCGACINPRP